VDRRLRHQRQFGLEVFVLKSALVFSSKIADGFAAPSEEFGRAGIINELVKFLV